MNSVESNYKVIQSEINQSMEDSKYSTSPKVIVVTKYVTIDRAIEAYNAGFRHFGENRLEGFLEKKKHLPSDVIMHFIGSLQTRKVKDIINEIDYLHSLDRLKLAKEIDKRADHKVKCFIQVNVSGEESKQGISPEGIEMFLEELEPFTNIEIVGLMTMAPLTDDKAQVKIYFKQLKKIQEKIQSLDLNYAPCTELSMGMSNDYNEAIAEGATYIRIGTKLVGE